MLIIVKQWYVLLNNLNKPYLRVARYASASCVKVLDRNENIL